MRVRVRPLARARVLSCVLALLGGARFAGAQVAPNEAWRTLSTEHFRVEFPARLESLARRAGGEAERAWTRLSAELTPPRTPVDLVLSDDQDASNGQATFYPTNRIIIWARPPIDDAALRFGDDWLQQVVTHELAHVFHLDRTRGLWRVAQAIFGRHPSLFPNARSPRWLTEGIAVAYESQLGSGGRLNGSDLFATLDAAALTGRPLSPDRLSIATPYWPVGDLAYFAGARLVAESERAGGDSAMRRFVESVASFPIPYLWDLHARRAFGSSFGALAHREPRPDVAGSAVTLTAVAGPFWEARAPRWIGDSIFFTASAPRELPGLYVVRSAAGKRVDLVARRNNTDAFGFARGHVVYAQLDFTDPYRLFSALYVGNHRLKATERMASPDARADGAIVAVETADGCARLVLLGADGTRVRALNAQDPDVQWSAPRWSRRGDRIAAIRWMRGGESEVVVLDTLGGVLASYSRVRAVQSHPSWDVNDRALYFTSDRLSRSAILRVTLTGADSANVEEAYRDPFGVYDAEVSPTGTMIAAFRFTPEGPDLIVVGTRSFQPRIVTAAASAFAPGKADTIVRANGTIRRYSALRTLIPRYWVPTYGTSSRSNALLGFYTSGLDVVGRYSLAVDGSWDARSGEFYGNGSLTYSGFGRPVVNVGLSQSWSFFRIETEDAARLNVGEVTRRNRVASFTLTWSRPRVRTGLAITGGAELEWRDFRAHPDSLALHLDPPLPDGAVRYPAFVMAAAWSNVSRSTLSLGPEDGLSLGITARRRWRAGGPAGNTAHSVIGVGRLYKSLPLGGHARHVLALRGAYGWAEPNITSLFSVGGVSGASLELLPGYSVGDVQRSFFVRGFPPGVLTGIRAWGGTAEYRAPLARVGRGLWPLPFFWQRSAVALFGDAGSAWCPVFTVATATCPTGGTPRTTLASVGAELLFDAAVDYDTPTRFRLGVAAPVRGKTAVRAKSATAYFSLGLPF